MIIMILIIIIIIMIIIIILIIIIIIKIMIIVIIFISIGNTVKWYIDLPCGPQYTASLCYPSLRVTSMLHTRHFKTLPFKFLVLFMVVIYLYIFMSMECFVWCK